MVTEFKFGIQSVDDLFGGEGGLLGDKPDPTKTPESLSVCIVGVDGTGKSVLALHLASYYFHQMKEFPKRAFVFYATTDLSFTRAKSIWGKFWLNRPTAREQVQPFKPPLKEYPEPTFQTGDSKPSVTPSEPEEEISLLQFR